MEVVSEQMRRRLEGLEAELGQRRRAEECLRQSEERFRLLVEHSGEILFRFRLRPRGFEYVSPVVGHVLGYCASEFYANPDLVLDIVHADDRALLQGYLAARDFARPLALRCHRRDGSVLWLEQRSLPTCDADGTIVAVEGLVRDVTAYGHLFAGLEHRAVSTEERERLVTAFHRIGAATVESLELDHVVDALAAELVRAGIFRSLMVALVDHERRMVRVARNYLSFEGRYAEGIGEVRPGAEMTPSPTVTRRDGERLVLCDQRIIDTTYDLDDGNITPTVARTGELIVIDGPDDRFDPRIERDIDAADRDRTVSYFIPIKRDGRVLAVIATGSEPEQKQEILRRIDVMQPLLAQAAIALDHALIFGRTRSQARDLSALNARLREEVSRRLHAEGALRDFSSRTVRLAEEERRRVARELHDGVNQLLCAVGFGIDAALEGNGGGRARESIGRARELLDRTIREVRRISHDLRPVVLDDLGLVPALRSLCDEFARRTGLSVSHGLAEPGSDLPQEMTITIYRLVQECLYRLERQQGSGPVSVELSRSADGLCLRVYDGGRLGPGGRESESLQSMRARADLFGGRLYLETVGGGSCLVVHFPVPGGAGGPP